LEDLSGNIYQGYSVMSTEDNIRLRATVSGHVQGVYFRAFVQEQAAMLHLTGWVRNRWNGVVEVTAEGSRENLERLLAALKQGPPTAMVEDVCDEWEDATGEFRSFEVVRTA
jgi:acylphosphatase